MGRLGRNQGGKKLFRWSGEDQEWEKLGAREQKGLVAGK